MRLVSFPVISGHGHGPPAGLCDFGDGVSGISHGSLVAGPHSKGRSFTCIVVSRQSVHSRQPVHPPKRKLHHFLLHRFSICLDQLRFGLNTTENMNRSGCYTKFYEKM